MLGTTATATHREPERSDGRVRVGAVTTQHLLANWLGVGLGASPPEAMR